MWYVVPPLPRLLARSRVSGWGLDAHCFPVFHTLLCTCEADHKPACGEGVNVLRVAHKEGSLPCSAPNMEVWSKAGMGVQGLQLFSNKHNPSF